MKNKFLFIFPIVLCFFTLKASSQCILEQIDLSVSLNDIAINTVTNKIYVSNQTDGTIVVIDGATRTVEDTIILGEIPYYLSVNSSTDKLYVSHFESDQVSVVDISTNTVLYSITVGTSPGKIAINEGSNKVYITNYGSDTVSVVDGATDTVEDTVDVGDGPFGIGFNPVTGKIYVANVNADDMYVLDAMDNSVLTSFNVNYDPISVVVDSTSNKIYVTEFSSDSTSIIDGSTDSVEDTIYKGQENWGIVVDSSSNIAYVTSLGTNELIILDLNSNDEIRRIDISDPQEIVFNPGTDEYFVVDVSSGIITVLGPPDPLVVQEEIDTQLEEILSIKTDLSTTLPYSKKIAKSIGMQNPRITKALSLKSSVKCEKRFNLALDYLTFNRDRIENKKCSATVTKRCFDPTDADDFISRIQVVIDTLTTHMENDCDNNGIVDICE